MRTLRSTRGGGQHDIARFGLSALFRYTPGTTGATVIRSTTATFRDVTTARQTAGVNVLRDGHYVSGVRTTLLEGASTNHFAAPAAPATQTSPSLTTGTYTLWMEGTGSIAVAGTTATITGAGTASAGVNVTFTVTVAGTVTYTVTGSPTLAQAESLAFASSYIGSASTRGADSDSAAFTAVPQALTGYAKFVALAGVSSVTQGVFSIGNAAASGIILEVYQGSGTASFTIGHNGLGGFVSSASGVTFAVGDTAELRPVLTATGAVQMGVSKNGAAEVVSTLSGVSALAASWSAPTLWLGSLGTVSPGYAAFQSVKFAAGVRAMTEMRNL